MKKIFSIVMVAMMLMMFSTPVKADTIEDLVQSGIIPYQGEISFQYGADESVPEITAKMESWTAGKVYDVNNDGSVNIFDLKRIYNSILDCEDIYSLRDVMFLKRYLLEIDDSIWPVNMEYSVAIDENVKVVDSYTNGRELTALIRQNGRFEMLKARYIEKLSHTDDYFYSSISVPMDNGYYLIYTNDELFWGPNPAFVIYRNGYDDIPYEIINDLNFGLVEVQSFESGRKEIYHKNRMIVFYDCEEVSLEEFCTNFFECAIFENSKNAYELYSIVKTDNGYELYMTKQ